MVDKARSDNVGDSVRNAFWAYLSFFSTKGLKLISIVVLAWYLEPAEFGTMAICLAIMGYFEIISQFGMGAALISTREKVEETASAVLLCGLLFSTSLAVLLWLAAGPIADWYGDPLLADLLPVIAIALVIRALTTVNMNFLVRELRLKAKMVPDVSRGLAKGLISILLAVLGFGVWSLVLGHLIGAIAATVAAWIMRPWWPTRRPDFERFRYIAHFGAHLIGAQTINATPRLLDNLLIGKILGASALGIYSLAYRIPELGIKSFTNVAGFVLHPVMSNIQSDLDSLKTYYYGALKYCALLMFGTGAGIAVVAEPLVHVLYPPRWYSMIVPMQLLAIGFAVGTLNMVPGNLLKALSRTDLMLKVSLINLPFFVVLIWFAVPHGIIAVAFIQVILAIIQFLSHYLFLKNRLDISARRTFRALVPGVVCAAAASAMALIAQNLSNSDSDVIRLTVGAAAFALAFLVSLRITAPEVFKQIEQRWIRKAGRAA
ncbi:lipopolysaccharide biosynthesis protein [Ruegeria atlantica]|uniref:Teichuronic acid biosynthesis protein TuaB n=1 Tax=Ruegeria atlantica TaxID=81569 RepID=A0A0P1E2H2_9RHOB|nr:lipopolysaccharide biosynthesis protein [Ruegeria atlantica]CUH42217.1 Teichuronic acid biosynthesis protein TuaB [Ruegeria atlantica]